MRGKSLLKNVLSFVVAIAMIATAFPATSVEAKK